MKQYVIERGIPRIGEAGPQQLQQTAQRSNEVLAQLGPAIEWVESYVVGDQTFCVYRAENEELIRRHAEASGFPADRIHEVRHVIDPSTAEAGATPRS